LLPRPHRQQVRFVEQRHAQHLHHSKRSALGNWEVGFRLVPKEFFFKKLFEKKIVRKVHKPNLRPVGSGYAYIDDLQPNSS
jgi:hypothetical protein